GAGMCALGVALGVWARDSKGRAIAWVAIVLGAGLIYVYLFSSAFEPHLAGPEADAPLRPNY
ncbi:MAG: hypothetical protein JSW65_02690, partial [Candidatus Bipolaricaulota bacterium]